MKTVIWLRNFVKMNQLILGETKDLIRQLARTAILYSNF